MPMERLIYIYNCFSILIWFAIPMGFGSSYLDSSDSSDSLDSVFTTSSEEDSC